MGESTCGQGGVLLREPLDYTKWAAICLLHKLGVRKIFRKSHFTEMVKPGHG
jgi:hypothetical protein